LTIKEEIINNLSESNQEYLPDFFKLATLSKMMSVISTNGFEKTIPEFKNWLKNRKRSVFAGYYEKFIDEYIEVIDDVLAKRDDKSSSLILTSLNTEFLELMYKISSNGNYEELKKLYLKLEDIQVILEGKDYEKVINDLKKLREVDPIDFEYLVIHETRNRVERYC
jgi:hypothetical protein